MLKIIITLALAATSIHAHPAVDAAQRVYTHGLRPGHCRHYTRAALNAGAIGRVHLSPIPGRTKDGSGHVTPLIRDGRGRLQFLREGVSTYTDPTTGMVSTRPRLFRKTVPLAVEQAGDATIAEHVRGYFNAHQARDHYGAARVIRGNYAPWPACVIDRERELGYRSNMSRDARDRIERQAARDCEITRTE